MTKTQPDNSTVPVQQTAQQAVEKFLRDNDIRIAIVVRGRKTGMLYELTDFLPDGFIPVWLAVNQDDNNN